MPSNIIKNTADEKAWKKAKKIAKKQGKSNSWALVVHIFQQIKKNDTGHNNKNNTVDGNRRKEVKLLKTEQRKAAATALYNRIVELKSMLSKADDESKKKSKYKQWEPTVDPTDPMNRRVKEFINSGFHPREAEYLGGNDRVRLKHGVQSGLEITPFSDAMLAYIKPFIEKHDHIIRSSENADTEPDKNPHKNIAHHVNEYAALRAKLYEPEIEKLKNSPEFKSLSFAEKSKRIQNFNKEWEANPPQELQILKDRLNSAKILNPKLRREEVKNIRAGYTASGGSAGGLRTQEEVSDEHTDMLNEILNESGGGGATNYSNPTEFTGKKDTSTEQKRPEEDRREKIKSLFKDNPSYSDAYAYIAGLYNPVIESMVFRYLQKRYPNQVRTKRDAQDHPDSGLITQNAMDGLVRAVRKLDPKKGDQFSYIKNSIMGAVHKENKKRFNEEVVPSDYEKAKKDARSQLGSEQDGTPISGQSNTQALASLGANVDEGGVYSGIGVSSSPGEHFKQKFKSFIDKNFTSAPTASAPTASAPTASAPTASAPTKKTVVRRLNPEQEERKKLVDSAKINNNKKEDEK